MSFSKGPFKLDPSKDTYDQECGWVAHPNGCPKADSEEAKLVAKRYDLVIHGLISDDEASYSYDDWALVSLGKKYYLLSTSGCSCPSPSETWSIQIGPTTLAKIRAFITEGLYDGYSMPKRQLEQFIEMLDTVEKEPKT